MRIALGAIALEALWLPLYVVLHEGAPWELGALAVGPFAFAAAGVVGPVTATRERWGAAARLAGILFALDLAFELLTRPSVPVATTLWELVRLGAIGPAVALGHGPAGRWLARRAFGLAAIGALGAFGCLAVCLVGALPSEERGASKRADAAIVLGFALTSDGRAAPSLVARVRHAVGLYREGVVPRLVLTGGPGDGRRAESAVADELARRAGLPPEAILREEFSRNTAENLAEAARVVRRLRCRSVLLVTEPYHMGRAMLLARARGLRARPSPSGSPLWRLRAAPYWVAREIGYMPVAVGAAVRGPVPPEHGEATLELVETAPVETTLNHADLRDAHVVWPERFARARSSIDVAQFYASNEPASRLEPVVRALLSAADRGVSVRFLADGGFARTYPDTLARLDAHGGIVVRTLDLSLGGRSGVLHEKAFVIDREEAWLGSQNFDWRSLTHVQELGVSVGEWAIARALVDIFESDWARAGGATRPVISKIQPKGYGFPPGLTLVASPRDDLPDESLWDLPHLLAWIDGARRSVRVQLLTYGDDEGRWPVLSDALRRAAARGVRVEVIVSNWALRAKPRAALARLLAPGLTVKIATIPPARSGFIPFARVVHAKYMVVDGVRAWIGTSNWEREYFHESRNVGLLVERRSVARRVDAFFGGLWSSAYVETFDPQRSPPAPRIAE